MKEFHLFGRDRQKQAGDGVFKAVESRTFQAKVELAATRAASHANTARLRALRLEKERQDKAAAAVLPAIVLVKAKRKPIRRVTG